MSFARRRLHSTTFYRPEMAYNGYTLFTPMALSIPGTDYDAISRQTSTAWLVDMEGNIVHSWQLPGKVRMHAELLPNGNLLCAVDDPGIPKGHLQLPFSGPELFEIDWDGNIVWKYHNLMMECHDRARLKNGNTLIIQYYEIPKEIAAKVKGGVPGSEKDGIMWGYALKEINPEGKVVWDWLPHEHLDFELDAITPLCPRYLWPGFNSIDELPDGDIIACSFHTSNLYIISKETGEVKWRWGQNKISFPHDPHMLSNGNIIVLDNGRFHTDVYFPPDFSRIVEVNPATNEIEWVYKAGNPVDFYTTYIGGCQRLPNGNTLICEGAMGRFFEVSPKGELVWEYINPFYAQAGGNFGLNNSVYRCFRYGPDHPALQGKILDPQKYQAWNKLYAGNFFGKTSGHNGSYLPAAKGCGKMVQNYQNYQPGASSFDAREDKVVSKLKNLGY